MKIITDNAVYVQKTDMEILTKCGKPMPGSIFVEALNADQSLTTMEEKYQFLEFTKPEDILFFKEASWIVDYEEVKKLTVKQITKIINQLFKETNKLVDKYNDMSPSERINNGDICIQYEFLKFRMKSLKNIMLFKSGNVKVDFPDGIDDFNELKKESEKNLVKILFNKIQKTTLL